MFTRLRTLAETMGGIRDMPRDGADFALGDFLLFDAILDPVEVGQA